MTKKDIKEQFFLFLKENSCYNKYFNNLNFSPIRFNHLTKLLDYPIHLINFAFDWSLSEEGLDYWENISNKWILIYKSYLKKNIYYYKTTNNNIWND
jgi:hypothetical protein